MKLEVGMYVRTKKGIAKIVEIFNKEDEPYEDAKYETDTYLEIYYDSTYIGDEDISKASHNIIDLIEVGDYVNGYIVENVVKDVLCSYVQLEPVGLYVENYEEIDEKDIKSIVTKQQFSAMEYKID